jgi:hypothetical protein
MLLLLKHVTAYTHSSVKHHKKNLTWCSCHDEVNAELV